MNDFYEQKANKYKYKYLKLKNELKGGMFRGLLKYIGIDHTNCEQKIYTFSPPIQILSVPNKLLTNEYIGQIMTYDEYDNYMKIKNLDKDDKCTFKVVYENKSINQSDIKISEYKNCLDAKITYNYIISKKSGKLFSQLEKKEDINKDNIKDILKSLKEGIEKIIKPLYEKGIILGNIKMENMYLDTSKVYFSDYSKMHTYTDNNKVAVFSANLNTKIKSAKPNYSLLLAPFFKLEKDKNDKTKGQKEAYDKEFLKSFYETNIIIKDDSISEIDRKDALDALNAMIPSGYNKSLDEFYNDYIKNLAQNTDIYAIVMFIYIIFMGKDKTDKNMFEIGDQIQEQTKTLIQNLYDTVLKNDSKISIKYLIDQIDKIIESIK